MPRGTRRFRRPSDVIVLVPALLLRDALRRPSSSDPRASPLPPMEESPLMRPLGRRLLAAVLVGRAVLVVAPPARADRSDETALAARFAPSVRLVEQPEECGHGEPYQPIDVDLLFGEPTVALRGPWKPADLVKIGPSAKDLVRRFEYHLDFPGNALHPGCDYERWERW